MSDTPQEGLGAKRSVLVVDDDPSMARLVSHWLEKADLATSTVGAATAVLPALARGSHACVLLDLHLAGVSGLSVLRSVRERHPEVPVVMITADESVQQAVTALQDGAFDYLQKPLDRDALLIAVGNAVRYSSTLGHMRARGSGPSAPEIEGRSAPMRRLGAQIARVGPAGLPVAIIGETGSGKELVARALHQASPRRTGPFVAVNCGAIPENLMASELFGHERGAFTGADRRRVGRFEQADGGTLFLDEVADLAPPLQASLLRVLQDGRFYRVGGTEEVATDVRIVSATHASLETAVEEGRFRTDLFHRIAGYELEVPPLRSRGDDVLLLAETLLDACCPDRAPPPIADDAVSLLRSYPWPGNVRELRNALECAALLCDGEIRRGDFPPRILRRLDRGRAPSAHGAGVEPTTAHIAAPDDRFAGRTLLEVEQAAIEAALERCARDVAAAAESLAVPRATLYRKMKKHGIAGRRARPSDDREDH
jgi:DNA-binding NtrC family response regulator